MTRIHVMSDIHDDYSRASLGNFAVPRDVEADVLVIAGDVAGRLSRMGRTWLEHQRRDVPILVVPGNHDFWRGSLEAEVSRFRERLQVDGIHVLDGDEVSAVVIDGTRFVGATLWTDYEVHDGDAAAGMKAAEAGMNDFHYIRCDGYDRRLRAWMLRDVHRRHRAAIEAVLAEPFDGPTVVVTHHAPSPRSLLEGRSTQLLDGAYASDLEDVMLRFSPELWIHGHVHSPRDYVVGRTRVACNPRGYRHAAHPRALRQEIETPSFDERLVLTVGRRPAPSAGDGLETDPPISAGP